MTARWGRRTGLAGAATLALAAGTALLPTGSPLRLTFALPLLCVLPGYALTTVLFPATATETAGSEAIPADDDVDARPAALSSARRVACSLGFSLVLVPFVGLGLAALGLPYAQWPFTLGVAGVTLCLLAVGAYRRHHDVDPTRLEGAGTTWVRRWLDGGTPTDTGLRVAIVVVAALAVSALWVGLVDPQDGSAYTETTLLTQNESGALVAGNYPTDRNAGDTDPLVYRIENHEGRAVNYGVVLSCQRVGADGTVERSAELSRLTERVPAGASLRVVDPPQCSLDGERVRLVFSLYRGSIPADPSTQTDYRTLTLWVETPPVSNTTTTTTTTSRSARVGPA